MFKKHGALYKNEKQKKPWNYNFLKVQCKIFNIGWTLLKKFTVLYWFQCTSFSSHLNKLFFLNCRLKNNYYPE